MRVALQEFPCLATRLDIDVRVKGHVEGLGYSGHLDSVSWVPVLYTCPVFIEEHLCFQLLSAAYRAWDSPK